MQARTDSLSVSDEHPRAARADICVVVPVFNERDSLAGFLDAVVPVLESLDLRWEIVVVDDGSTDGSAQAVRAARPDADRVVVVQLARNFGKEAAVCAGLDVADAAAVVVMDVDLQDPPDLIPEFVRLWREGADIVYGARVSRSSDTLAKRLTAQVFYRVFNKLADVRIPSDAGDFRLMDGQVVDVIRLLPERSRFMKGLFSWPGFTQAAVPYDRPARVTGRSGWSYRKLWRYGLDGVFNFSSIPLRLWTYVGVFIVLAGLAFLANVVIQTLFFGNGVRGYASTIAVITVLGGIQVMGIGLVGEYLSRIFLESKRRPLYVIRSAERMPTADVMRHQVRRSELETFAFTRSR